MKRPAADQVDPVDPHNALKLMDPGPRDNGPKLVDPADPGVLIFHINHILHHLNPCKYNDIKYSHNKYHDIKHNIYKYHDINPCKLQRDNPQPP